MRCVDLFEARLPRDETARLARAKTMGFDLSRVWYHGTKHVIHKFDMRRTGRASGSYHELPTIWLTSDPTNAADYANVGPKMNSGLNWGEFREQFIKPMEAVLADPSVPIWLKHSAEKILRGGIDIGAMERENFLPPHVISQMKRLVGQWNMSEEEGNHALGARVMPLVVRGHFIPTKMADNFDEFMYDLHLKHALANHADGVWFQNVVDTPSGHGDDADVLGVLNRNVIRSKFANFDLAKIASPNLMA
jgi:hypothetical protein